MSRRKLLWRKKLGYDSAREIKGNRDEKGYHTSQCGGSLAKLQSTRPVARRGYSTKPMRKEFRL